MTAATKREGAPDAFQFTTDEQREDSLFSNGRVIQDASELEIIDDLSMRHHDEAKWPADAQRALYLAKWQPTLQSRRRGHSGAYRVVQYASSPSSRTARATDVPGPLS